MKIRDAVIGILVVFIAANTPAQRSRQRLKSFDPNAPGACERAIGPPEDDSIIASRGWMLNCGELDKDIENSEFATMRASEEKTTKSEFAAYTALLAAFEKYRKLQLRLFALNCGGGNSCGAEEIEQEARINYSFLIMTEGFRDAGFPSFSASDFSDADAALNKTYREALSRYPATCAPQGSDDYSEFCASRTDIRAMERAWIRYRDAWVNFGAIKWPQVSAYTWRTYLTRERAKRGS